ncbi:barstar family protein [Streptomyces sp. NPDC001851]|uniref:barstar family protein n=1 Tax=Streptomyces sp. NPDC001851 TaxID=3154529 RepID=UPI003326B19D
MAGLHTGTPLRSVVPYLTSPPPTPPSPRAPAPGRQPSGSQTSSPDAHARTYAARLDGGEMHDTDAVFQQFYDGLRLPDYLGWNWDALSGCLRNLKWLSADHHVLIFKAADEALSGNASGRRLLFKTLLRAGRHWSFTQRPAGVELSRLAIVMACDAESVPLVQGQLRSCWEEMALP